MIQTGAALGYKPWEVMRLTPRELDACVRGFNVANGGEEKADVDISDIKRRLAAMSG